jgi:hypothetical protein
MAIKASSDTAVAASASHKRMSMAPAVGTGLALSPTTSSRRGVLSAVLMGVPGSVF